MLAGFAQRAQAAGDGILYISAEETVGKPSAAAAAAAAVGGPRRQPVRSSKKPRLPTAAVQQLVDKVKDKLGQGQAAAGVPLVASPDPGTPASPDDTSDAEAEDEDEGEDEEPSAFARGDYDGDFDVVEVEEGEGPGGDADVWTPSPAPAPAPGRRLRQQPIDPWAARAEHADRAERRASEPGTPAPATAYEDFLALQQQKEGRKSSPKEVVAKAAAAADRNKSPLFGRRSPTPTGAPGEKKPDKAPPRPELAGAPGAPRPRKAAAPKGRPPAGGVAKASPGAAAAAAGGKDDAKVFRQMFDKRECRRMNAQPFAAAVHRWRLRRVANGGFRKAKAARPQPPGGVKMYVRKRPLFAHEQKRGEFDVVTVPDPPPPMVGPARCCPSRHRNPCLTLVA